MRYIDRYGRQIKAGDVVARRNENFRAYPNIQFHPYIVRRGTGRDPSGGPMRGRLILDGVNGWAFLADAERNDLAKLDGTVDLRDIAAHFASGMTHKQWLEMLERDRADMAERSARWLAEKTSPKV